MRLTLFFLLSLFSTFSLASTFKIATLTPDGSFWMTEMRKAASAISDETEGRVKFRFYPGGVMGNDAAVLRKMRIGQLQGAAFSGGTLARQAPDTQLYTIPLLFNDYDEVDYVRQHLDKKMEQAFEEAGFVNFGLAEGGFAYVMSKNAIQTTEDLQKNKIWAPGDDPIAQAAADAFKFSPISLSVGDVLTGLQTDLIDTVTISPVVAIALQWHSQIRHITDLPLAYFFAILVIDDKSFSKVSAADQKIVHAHMRKAFANIGEQNRKDNDAAFIALQEQGISLVKPTPEQLADWHKMTRDTSERFVEKAGIRPELLEEVNKLLSEYRQKHAK